MMALEEDIQTAIDQNLTNEVATRLKDRLERADLDAEEVVKLRSFKEANDDTIHCLQQKCSDIQKFEELKADCIHRTRVLDLKEAVMEARREERKEAVNQIYNLARIAFDNPRLKFKADFTIPASQDSYSTPSHVEGGETTERD